MKFLSEIQRQGGHASIVSYGIRNPIVGALTLAGIRGVDVHATNLIVERGVVTGHEQGTIVTPLGKDKTVKDILGLQDGRSQTIVIGDSPSDISMYQKETVNVHLHHPGALAYGDRLPGALTQIASHVDAIVIADSFAPINQYFGIAN